MAETSEGFSKGRYISNHTLAETSKAGRLARIRLGACQRVAKNSDEKRMERIERVVEWKVEGSEEKKDGGYDYGLQCKPARRQKRMVAAASAADYWIICQDLSHGRVLHQGQVSHFVTAVDGQGN